MAEFYEYRSAGRRPLTLAGFALLLILTLILARDGGGPVIWSAWGLIALLTLHHLIFVHHAGCRMDAAHLETYLDFRHTDVPLSRILRAQLTPQRGGHCACTLTLDDGTPLQLPAACLPPAPTLAACLKARGIPVEIG